MKARLKWPTQPVCGSRPETGRSIHGQVEASVKRRGGPHQCRFCLDELWIAVKCYSSPEIAGSPRNSYKASVVSLVSGGRALFWTGALTGTHP